MIGGSGWRLLRSTVYGLDTLQSLGVVLLSLGVQLEDFVAVALALVVGVAGVLLAVVLGDAAQQLRKAPRGQPALPSAFA